MTATFFIPQEQCGTVFDRSVPPVLEVEPGSIVTFESGAAAYERIWRGEPLESIRDDEYNLVTGPLRIRGTEPGDALRVDVLDIVIRQAWAVWLQGSGPLGGLTPQADVQPVPIVGGRLQLSVGLRFGGPASAMVLAHIPDP